jgi:hypothetical protein
MPALVNLTAYAGPIPSISIIFMVLSFSKLDEGYLRVEWNPCSA